MSKLSKLIRKMDSQTVRKLVDESLRRGPGNSPLYDFAIDYLAALPDGPHTNLPHLVEEYRQADVARNLPGAGNFKEKRQRLRNVFYP